MEFLQGDHIALLMCVALGGYHYDKSENGKHLNAIHSFIPLLLEYIHVL